MPGSGFVYKKRGDFLEENKAKINDIAVVGCGPAGLSAAVNISIRKKSLLLLGAEICSPKLYRAEKVNNYLGYYNLSGEELMKKFIAHIAEMGIDISRSRIDNIYLQDDYYTLASRDKTYHAYTLVLAPGVSNNKYLPGEEELLGSGVSYCATCDGALYRNKDVAVIAYTEEGIEESEYLAEIVDTVYFIPQFDFEDGFNISNIKTIKDSPLGIEGDVRVEGLRLKKQTIDLDGVFILREVTPADKLLYGLALDEKGHIKVDENMASNLPGVYAAGDCTGTPYQLARAVGQGQVAGLNAVTYVHRKKRDS
ncbi:thioredoxin reductase [Iocasia frigidifontis]|uniref:Thioredoxin reductase n=1 Tax=Iocasia fonsfrigidae TaxID=2682810 RepID=A0A8A7KLI5_9FIRM|nr:thioredoxin reductase [Iocasia fonsfrigidae]